MREFILMPFGSINPYAAELFRTILHSLEAGIFSSK